MLIVTLSYLNECALQNALGLKDATVIQIVNKYKCMFTYTSIILGSIMDTKLCYKWESGV